MDQSQYIIGDNTFVLETGQVLSLPQPQVTGTDQEADGKTVKPWQMPEELQNNQQEGK